MFKLEIKLFYNKYLQHLFTRCCLLENLLDRLVQKYTKKDQGSYVETFALENC